MSSFRGVRRTAVQMPMLRGSRGWLSSVSEAPDAVMADFHRHVSVAVFVSVAVSVAVSVTVSVTVSVKPCPYLPFMHLLLGRVCGNSATGPGGRAPSFPQKSGRSSRRVQTAGTEKYERMNGNGELTETENVIFYVSYGVLAEFLRMNINQSINQSIKTHFYSAICRERIRGA